MNIFFDRFNQILAYALHAKKVCGSSQNAKLEDLANELFLYVEDERKKIYPKNLTRYDVDLCHLAIYTFVDELLLSVKMSWFSFSLQNKYFGKNDGGEIFYNNLEQIVDSLYSELYQNPNNNEDISLAQYENSLLQKWQVWLNHFEHNKASYTDNSKLMLLSTYALCLSYGFKGKLHNNAIELDALRKLACHTLINILPKNTTLFSEEESLKIINDSKKFSFEFLFHIFVPLGITILWYFICNDIMLRIG